MVDLAIFDEQLRQSFADLLIEGEQVERIGPLTCISGAARGGFVGYRDLAGVEGAELDALIERCIAWYAERRERFEWKLYGHDRPPELAHRLEAAGFVPEERETVEIALTASIAGDPELPAGVALRQVRERADLDRIARFEGEIWGTDRDGLGDMLEGRLAAAPDSLAIAVVESGAEIVCAGWVSFAIGTDFASLWGGSTLPRLAATRNLPRHGRLPGEPRRNARVPLPAGRRFRPQPPDPGTARLRAGDDNDALHLVTPRSIGKPRDVAKTDRSCGHDLHLASWPRDQAARLPDHPPGRP